MNLMRPLARAKGLELVLNCQADLPKTVLGDGGRLRQVLINPIATATKSPAPPPAADAPPEEPPGVIAVLRGFSVWPCRSLRVNQRRENAGVFVRPTITPPAARMFETTGLSACAISCNSGFRIFWAYVGIVYFLGFCACFTWYLSESKY